MELASRKFYKIYHLLTGATIINEDLGDDIDMIQVEHSRIVV